MRSTIALTTAAAVALVACGSDASDSQVTDTQLPDADQLVDDAEELGVSPLALAFDQTASATAYRVTMAIGMNLEMGPAMGGAMHLEADLATPMMTMESDAEGQQYTVVDLAPMMEATMEASGANVSALFGDDLGMETWLDGTTLYADLGGFSDLMAMSGTSFPSDRFSVDLTQLGTAIGGADVASALSGQAAPDPVEMAEVLRDVLTDVDGDGTSYSGTIGFLDYARAFGQDPSSMLGGSSTGFGDLLGDDGAQAIVDLFDEVQAEVDVTLADGAVDVIRFDVDLAPMFSGLVDAVVATGQEISDAERAEAESMFADATFDMTMLLDYDIDASVDVVVPTGDFPDATADFENLFGAALGG